MRLRAIVGSVFVWILVFGSGLACNKNEEGSDSSKDKENDDTDDTESDFESANRCAGVPMRPDDLFDAVTALKQATAAVPESEQPYLGMVIPYQTSFWVTPQLGVGHAVEELSCSINFTGAEAESASPGADQKTIVDGFVENRVDALAISCKDAELLEPSIVKGIAEDIPVITFDADGVAGSRRQLYLGTVNLQAGVTAGEVMLALLAEEGGQVALFLNSEGDANMIERKAGIQDIFAGTPAELVQTYSHNGDLELLTQNIQAAISDYPDLRGIISLNGHIGPILGDGLIEAGKVGQIKVVVFDLLFDTQVHLENEVIDATIVQQSYFFGYLGGHILYSMATIGVDETLRALEPWLDGEIFDTGTQVITKDNLQDYSNFMECLGVDESK